MTDDTWRVLLAPDIPTTTTEAIERMDKTLAANELLQRTALCVTCGLAGIHVHWKGTR